jgi:UDP-glucose 4-epimerase
VKEGIYLRKILITGSNSYVGNSFGNWMSQWQDRYICDTLDMKDTEWKNYDFSGYEIVFHVAGIAHVDTKHATNEIKEIYYKVNRDLAIQTAKKAKEAGVKQFIFMSSIIVYGEASSLKDKKIITREVKPLPTNFYGDSKLQAEKGILSMQSVDFNVVVLRPPMIYGKESKGNYPKLAKLARKTLVFPNIQNQRSMLHIDNLCEFVKLMIDNEESGIFYPQNDEYTCTSEMVKIIASIHGKRIKLTKVFNLLLNILPFKIIYKVFGTLIYDKEMSNYKRSYTIHKFKESIQITELK